ncbi:MAG TPA: hypothetical protein VF746_17035 [Longimicrobium sp.]|jgi:hypothetical protein
MIVLRCTQRVLKQSRIAPLPEPPEPTGVLGEWYVNAVSLPFPGRSLVLYVSSRTLLTVVAPGRTLGPTLPVFRERLPALLVRLRLPADWIEAEMRHFSEVSYAATRSRSVLGSMNNIHDLLWFHAAEAPSFERLDLDAMELELAGTPFGAMQYNFPDKAVAALAEGHSR